MGWGSVAREVQGFRLFGCGAGWTLQEVFLSLMNLRGNMRPKAYPDLSELFGLAVEVLSWLSFEPHKMRRGLDFRSRAETS